MKKICVVGIGYIGLPTASMFAKCGYDVVGVDVNHSVVNALNEGRVTIEEPYLGELVKEMVIANRLIADTKPCKADIFIIAVPTPIDRHKKSDMKYVIDACESIVPYIKEGNVVVLESTSPIGTTDDIMKNILSKSNLKIGEEIYLGYCPERVIPGKILEELVNNSRVIGGINQKSAKKIEKIYKSFVQGNIYLTDAKTAEMCKLMENTYRDVNIALANELAKICEEIGINAWEVIEYCNKHPRVNIHNPGPGVGGHCLAIDPWFIVEKVPDIAKIIELSRNTNDSMPLSVFKKIEDIIEEEGCNKNITILGATYKANIDDIRESPIMELIELLKNNDYSIKLYDPFIKNNQYLYDDIIDACSESEMIVLAVDHKMFEDIPMKELLSVMNNNIMLDLRNFYTEEYIEESGFRYRLLGKK